MQVNEDVVLPAAETATAFEGTSILWVAFLPDGSVHVTVACFIEEWCIACIFACMSKRDQHTEDFFLHFCISMSTLRGY